MSELSREELTAIFNQLSGKVVLIQEYNQREKALLKQELTFAQRVYSALGDVPRQAVSIAKNFSEIMSDEFTMYRDAANKKYVVANNMAKTEYDIYAGGLNKEFQDKALKCRLQALVECTDHSARVKSGELKLIS